MEFIFASIPEKEDQFVVMIDTDASQLNEKEGKPLFDEKGEAQKIVTQIKDYLSKFQVDIVKTQKILSLLEEKDILVSKQFAIAQGEKKNALRGFRVVDAKKLEKLDDETIVKWVRNGLMGIIYSHLNSISNLRKVAAAQGAVEK